jgi:hypothetical protein
MYRAVSLCEWKTLTSGCDCKRLCKHKKIFNFMLYIISKTLRILNCSLLLLYLHDNYYKQLVKYSIKVLTCLLHFCLSKTVRFTGKYIGKSYCHTWIIFLKCWAWKLYMSSIFGQVCIIMSSFINIINSHYIRVALYLKCSNIHVGFEVLTAMAVESTVIWDEMLCSPLEVNWCFGGDLCLPPVFMLVSCSAYSLTLKMEAICSSKMAVDCQQTTWRYITDDNSLLVIFMLV